jgi:hypothetical protein
MWNGVKGKAFDVFLIYHYFVNLIVSVLLVLTEVALSEILQGAFVISLSQKEIFLPTTRNNEKPRKLAIKQCYKSALCFNTILLHKEETPELEKDLFSSLLLNVPDWSMSYSKPSDKRSQCLKYGIGASKERRSLWKKDLSKYGI